MDIVLNDENEQLIDFFCEFIYTTFNHVQLNDMK